MLQCAKACPALSCHRPNTSLCFRVQLPLLIAATLSPSGDTPSSLPFSNQVAQLRHALPHAIGLLPACFLPCSVSGRAVSAFESTSLSAPVYVCAAFAAFSFSFPKTKKSCQARRMQDVAHRQWPRWPKALATVEKTGRSPKHTRQQHPSAFPLPRRAGVFAFAVIALASGPSSQQVHEGGRPQTVSQGQITRQCGCSHACLWMSHARVASAVRRLRGGNIEEADEDSAVQREAAALKEMGFEYLREGEELEKLDPEGRKITPAAPTVPGELCSGDDMSNPSEPDFLTEQHTEAEAAHFERNIADVEYMQSIQNNGVIPPLLSTVRVKYYDLACGATHNISDAFPEQPRISGLWQLALRVHGREYTFCAHRGVIIYPPKRSPFGHAMVARRVGHTPLRDDEVLRSLRTLHHRFNPLTFDPYRCTSIDFCEQLAKIIMRDEDEGGVGGRNIIPRSICTPILLCADNDGQAATLGVVGAPGSCASIHSREVNVTHLPVDLDPDIGAALGVMYQKWGQRPPNRMRLGPLGEEIGPFLPSVLSDYWEPPPGL